MPSESYVQISEMYWEGKYYYMKTEKGLYLQKKNAVQQAEATHNSEHDEDWWLLL